MTTVERTFLAEVYRYATGNPANLVDMLKVGKELGLSISETKRIVFHLAEEGLVGYKMNRYRIVITYAGCRRVEECNNIEIPQPQESIEENTLLEELKRMPPAWFDELVFRFNVGHMVSSKSAPQSVRAIDLLSILRSQKEGRARLHAEICKLKGLKDE